MSRAPHKLAADLAKDRSGVALVEFAIMLPLLIILALGLSEIGRGVAHYHAIHKGVRDAARFLARVPATCPTGAPTGSITDAGDVTRARNLAMTGNAAGGAWVVDYWNDPTTVSVAVTCFDNSAGTYRGKDAIPSVTVTATVGYQDLGFLDVLGFDPITFGISHQEMSIGE